MAITLPGGFSITNNEPADSRVTVADSSARLGFSTANVYEGLVVYQQDTDELYVLTNASAPGTAGSWTLISTGGGGIFNETGSYYATTNDIQITGSVDVTGSMTLEGDFLPQSSSTYDLGSLAKPWRDLYITTSSLNFVRDGQIVSVLNGGDDYIQVGNIRISTGSISVVDDSDTVITTIVNATGSGDTLVADVDPAVFTLTGSVYAANQDLDVTGSFAIDISDAGNVFSVSKNGTKQFELNNDGVVVLGSHTSAPTAQEGGMFYSSSGDFYVGS